MIKGEFNNLFRETRLHGHEFLFKLFRMTPSQREKWTEWVAPLIIKDSLHWEAISPEERLCVTLRCLASGDSHVSLAKAEGVYSVWYAVQIIQITLRDPKNPDSL